MSLITEDLISHREISELRKNIDNALDKNDYEAAITTLFSEYLAHNVWINKVLLTHKDELDFLRRMNRK